MHLDQGLPDPGVLHMHELQVLLTGIGKEKGVGCKEYEIHHPSSVDIHLCQTECIFRSGRSLYTLDALLGLDWVGTEMDMLYSYSPWILNFCTEYGN